MKYFGFYDTEIGRRAMSLAAVNKMNYICAALLRLGEPVDIYACGMIANENIPPKTESLPNGTKVHYFKTVKKSKNRIGRAIQAACQILKLFLFLTTKVKRDEQILVYHAPALMRCLLWAKRIRGFRLILETEEIYSDVSAAAELWRKKELRLMRCADKYLFSTELLRDKINVDKKPSCVNYGTYLKEEITQTKFDDGRIHVVYAGTFDPQKGGVQVAIETAGYLSKHYHMHILGFGSQKQNEMVCAAIEKVQESTQALISYNGMLTGKAFTDFLQKCHIGLSTQNPQAKFNDTSFPSKVLTYLANGLRVVSVRIPVIEASGVHESMYYYDKQEPEKIAEAILKICVEDEYDGGHVLDELDASFLTELEVLLQNRD